MYKLTESAYDWCKIPVDLPRENLVFITAKTTRPTLHKNDPEYPVRLFNPKELYEAARSLARRPMGTNHGQIIPTAFTIDSQWNETTQSVEALVYLPTPYINLIRRMESAGTPVQYSVEYTWRDEKVTPEGVEFIGLVFDRVDLVIGMNAGDRNTYGRLVETELGVHRRLMEAEGTPIEDIETYNKRLQESADSVMDRLGEPFAGFTDWDACIAHAKGKGVSNPDAWCGAIKAKVEPKGKESQVPNQLDVMPPQTSKEPVENMSRVNINIESNPQLPEQTNTMSSPTDVVQTPIEGLDTPQPHINVTGVGATAGEMGPLAPDPQLDNPDKNLNQEPAKEDLPKMDSEKNITQAQKDLSVNGGVQADAQVGGETISVDNDGKVNHSVKEGTDVLPMGPDKTDNSTENNNQPNGEECMSEEKKLKESQEDKDAEIKTLTDAVTRLQGQVSTNDKEKEKAIKDAEKRGKEAVITKIREVIPVSGFFAGNIAVTATKRVVDDVNRKLREVE